MPTASNISLTPASGVEPPYRIQQNGRDIPASDLPMQYAIAHRTAVSNEIEIVRADGTVLFVQNDVEPLYDSQGRIYGCVSVVRGSDVPQARRDRAARCRSPQGRVPRDALARAPQPARAHPHGDRSDAARARRSDADRKRAHHHGAPGAAPGADHRRPAGRRRASRRTRWSCGARGSTGPFVPQRGRDDARRLSRRATTADDRPARTATVGRRRCHATRAGGLEPPHQRRQVHRTGRPRESVGVRATAARPGSPSRIPASASRPRCWRASSRCSRSCRTFRDRTQGGLGIGLTLARG